MSTPDAIMQIQKESNRLTPMKYPALRTPRSTKKRDLGTVEWENRVQADQFVKDINCDNNYAVFVSFVEVYNNYIYDLLDDSFDLITADGSSAPKSKRIMEDTSKRNYVHGVKEIEVKSSNEAFDLCIKGMKRRRIGNTHLNLESSRSHSVFNIRLVQAPLDMEGVEMIEIKNTFESVSYPLLI
ncbi:hypothetical protein SSS_03862 [Sarcoptes scabiei]|nr:hypothetical protein SSS_03862 [Sarcoptes scabiei]